jgi:hypothetical protein
VVHLRDNDAWQAAGSDFHVPMFHSLKASSKAFLPGKQETLSVH